MILYSLVLHLIVINKSCGGGTVADKTITGTTGQETLGTTSKEIFSIWEAVRMRVEVVALVMNGVDGTTKFPKKTHREAIVIILSYGAVVPTPIVVQTMPGVISPSTKIE